MNAPQILALNASMSRIAILHYYIAECAMNSALVDHTKVQMEYVLFAMPHVVAAMAALTQTAQHVQLPFNLLPHIVNLSAVPINIFLEVASTVTPTAKLASLIQYATFAKQMQL